MTVIKTVGGWFRKLPGWLRASITTAATTFAATTLVALLGLLARLQEWVVEGGEPPDWSNLGRVAFSALIAAIAFVGTAILRVIRPPERDYSDSDS